MAQPLPGPSDCGAEHGATLRRLRGSITPRPVTRRAGVLPDSNVVATVPMVIEALCLAERGRALVARHAPLRHLVPLLTEAAYVASGDADALPLSMPELTTSWDELLRHLPAELRPQALDAVAASLRVRAIPRSGSP